MIHHSTYEDLFNKNEELRRFNAQYPTVVAVCLQKQYKIWEKSNRAELDKMGKLLTDLYELHVLQNDVHDYQFTAEGTPIFRSKEDEIDFKESWSNIMKMRCDIYL
jgi:hypothetical protein